MLHEGVARLEALAVEAARADGGERLVDVPARAERVGVGIEEGRQTWYWKGLSQCAATGRVAVPMRIIAMR